MSYKRLPFEQYFIDQSRGIYGGEPSFCFEYDTFVYEHGRHQHTVNYKVLYNEQRDVIQFYFKETDDETQWHANFEFWGRYYDSFQYKGKDIQLKTASGWGQMYNCIKWYIRNDYLKLIKTYGIKEVEIIGWSLGSALAQLCCQDLYFNFKVKSHVFTYGSVKPWYGRNKNMKLYLKDCYKECYNFGDHNDIVTYMVPLPGYFKMNKIKLKQNKFSIFRLFKPLKYHTEYWKPKYYINIDKKRKKNK